MGLLGKLIVNLLKLSAYLFSAVLITGILGFLIIIMLSPDGDLPAVFPSINPALTNSDLSKEPELIDFNNGEYYGQVDAGIPTGEGKFTNASGSIYIGTFVNGQFSGNGTRRTLRGAESTGTFFQWDLIDGVTKVKEDDGVEYIHEYRGGKIVSQSVNGKSQQESQAVRSVNWRNIFSKTADVLEILGCGAGASSGYEFADHECRERVRARQNQRRN